MTRMSSMVSASNSSILGMIPLWGPLCAPRWRDVPNTGGAVGNARHDGVAFRTSLTLVCLLLIGCASRDLSSPARRLVGHWTDRSGDQLYLGPIPHGQSVGTYTLIQPDGNTAKHRYSIISENPHGTQVMVNFLFNEGSSRADTYNIASRGDSAMVETTVLGFTVTTL